MKEQLINKLVAILSNFKTGAIEKNTDFSKGNSPAIRLYPELDCEERIQATPAFPSAPVAEREPTALTDGILGAVTPFEVKSPRHAEAARGCGKLVCSRT
jgi:hypothetical protein